MRANGLILYNYRTVVSILCGYLALFHSMPHYTGLLIYYYTRLTFHGKLPYRVQLSYGFITWFYQTRASTVVI